MELDKDFLVSGFRRFQGFKVSGFQGFRVKAKAATIGGRSDPRTDVPVYAAQGCFATLNMTPLRTKAKTLLPLKPTAGLNGAPDFALTLKL